MRVDHKVAIRRYFEVGKRPFSFSLDYIEKFLAFFCDMFFFHLFVDAFHELFLNNKVYGKQ